MTYQKYKESIADILDEAVAKYPYVVRAPLPDIASIKGSYEIAIQASIIFSSVCYKTCTCVVIKNRYGVIGTISLTLLCYFIQEAILHHQNLTLASNEYTR